MQHPITLLAIKDGVDRLQRPALVKDNTVVEQSLLIEHNPSIVQIGEQIFWLARPVFLDADLSELLLRDHAILALFDGRPGVGVAHFFEPNLYAMPAGSDARNALALVQPADRFRQSLVESGTTAVVGGAVAQRIIIAESLSEGRFGDRAHSLVFRTVAARLHDQSGNILAAEMPDIVHPISERIVAEHDAVMFVRSPVLGGRSPD